MLGFAQHFLLSGPHSYPPRKETEVCLIHMTLCVDRESRENELRSSSSLIHAWRPPLYQLPGWRWRTHLWFQNCALAMPTLILLVCLASELRLVGLPLQDDCSPSHCSLSSLCVWYTVAEPSRGGVTQSPLHVEPRDSSSPDVTRRSVWGWGWDVLNVQQQTSGKQPLTLSRQVFLGR